MRLDSYRASGTLEIDTKPLWSGSPGPEVVDEKGEEEEEICCGNTLDSPERRNSTGETNAQTQEWRTEETRRGTESGTIRTERGSRRRMRGVRTVEGRLYSLRWKQEHLSTGRRTHHSFSTTSPLHGAPSLGMEERKPRGPDICRMDRNHIGLLGRIPL